MRVRLRLLLLCFSLILMQAPVTLAADTKPKQQESTAEFLPWDSPRFSPLQR